MYIDMCMLRVCPFMLIDTCVTCVSVSVTTVAAPLSVEDRQLQAQIEILKGQLIALKSRMSALIGQVGHRSCVVWLLRMWM